MGDERLHYKYVHQGLNGTKGHSSLTMNPARSRIPSLTSLFTNSSMDDRSKEIFGFRRFARTYILGSERSGRNEDMKTASQTKMGSQKSNMAGSTENRFRMAMNQEPSTETHKLNVPGQLVDYDTDPVLLSQHVPELITDGSSAEVEPHFHIAPSSSCSTPEEPWNRKSVVFKNIPANVGLGSILTQICGGPLESLSVTRFLENNNNRIKSIECSFLTHEAAWDFMNYGRTNLFQVNGVHISPSWSKSNNNTETEQDNMTSNCKDISRSLVLKRYANKKTAKDVLSRESLIDKFDVKELQQDFETFGPILEISPIISRKLCISVSYTNIASAARVMKDYEDSSSALHKKYFKTWAIWYGKDPTDRPCPEL